MVMGIVGFGDLLVNLEKIFCIFEFVVEKVLDIKFCLLINGLVLFEYVDWIKVLNIDYVILIINMVDFEIGVKIYFWVYYKWKCYKGIEGVKILY